ncbi:MAG: hypothetical protein ABIJ56_22685 [Pseudomonadota bacterium]
MTAAGPGRPAARLLPFGFVFLLAAACAAQFDVNEDAGEDAGGDVDADAAGDTDDGDGADAWDGRDTAGDGDGADAPEQGECDEDNECRDGNPCNGEETCDTDTHTCADGTPPGEGTPCDDGLFCTKTDECSGAGDCIGAGDTCDDGLGCTDDFCGESSDSCDNALQDSYCTIGGECVVDGTEHAANECRGCDASANQYGWTDMPDTMACSSDGVECTLDLCDGEGACGHPIISNACYIGGECHDAYDRPGDNACLECKPPATRTDWSPRAGAECDDGNYCTQSDTCTSEGFCEGDPIEMLYGAAAIDAGGSHNCVKLNTTGLRCWGNGGYGQAGNGIFGAILAPDDVTGLTTGAQQVSAGTRHTCAVVEGGVKCWGNNDYGQLGNGTSDTDMGTPVDVVGLESTVVEQVCAGGGHSCALLSTGRVMCWGSNAQGQLGNGESGSGAEEHEPVTVQAATTGSALEGAASLHCGGEYYGSGHTCALMDSGEVMCWGYNSYGQLGDDTRTHRSRAVYVVASEGSSNRLGGAMSLSLGRVHSCAVLGGGMVACWGRNDEGQLGDGTTATKDYPVPAGTIGNASSISMGGDHSCAKLRTGEVMCWGSNDFGELGNGTYGSGTIRTTPVYVVEEAEPSVPMSRVSAIASGFDHTCAVLLEDDVVKCWGSNSAGQLGDERDSGDLSPWPVIVHCERVW